MRSPATNRSEPVLFFITLAALFCAGCLRTAGSDGNRGSTSRHTTRASGTANLGDSVALHILKAGTLRKQPASSLLSFERANVLRKHGWTGQEFNELVYPYVGHVNRQFCLMYNESLQQSLITHVIDLRWKVEISTPSDVDEFLDLIGGIRTKHFFRDSRGWEVVSQDSAEAKDHCSVSREDFERLGLKRREITRVRGGFIVRRTLYRKPHEGFPCDLPGDLIESREFVGSDGQYVFGCERLFAARDELPYLSFYIDHHDLVMTYYYRAIFPCDRDAR